MIYLFTDLLLRSIVILFSLKPHPWISITLCRCSNEVLVSRLMSPYLAHSSRHWNTGMTHDNCNFFSTACASWCKAATSESLVHKFRQDWQNILHSFHSHIRKHKKYPRNLRRKWNKVVNIHLLATSKSTYLFFLCFLCLLDFFLCFFFFFFSEITHSQSLQNPSFASNFSHRANFDKT